MATKFFKLEWLEYYANQHVDNMTSIELVLDYISFLLIVYNYKEFMKHKKKDKKLFEEVYRDYILPWYDHELVERSYDRERIDFNVLLIEDKLLKKVLTNLKVRTFCFIYKILCLNFNMYPL